MRPIPTTASMLALAIACASCQPREEINPGTGNGGDDTTPAGVEGATRGPAPLDPEPAAATLEDAAVRYACDDGSEIRIAHTGSNAVVTLADGRSVIVPRAESASQGGGDDAYVGEALSLVVEGDTVQLHQDEGPMRNCRAS